MADRDQKLSHCYICVVTLYCFHTFSHNLSSFRAYEKGELILELWTLYVSHAVVGTGAYLKIAQTSYLRIWALPYVGFLRASALVVLVLRSWYSAASYWIVCSSFRCLLNGLAIVRSAFPIHPSSLPQEARKSYSRTTKSSLVERKSSSCELKLRCDGSLAQDFICGCRSFSLTLIHLDWRVLLELAKYRRKVLDNQAGYVWPQAFSCLSAVRHDLDCAGVVVVTRRADRSNLAPFSLSL